MQWSNRVKITLAKQGFITILSCLILLGLCFLGAATPSKGQNFDWERDEQLNEIRAALLGIVGENYAIGPVESFSVDRVNRTDPWIGSFNYYIPFFGDNYQDPITGLFQPAILRVYEPGQNGISPRLIQEFQEQYSYIYKIGWIETNEGRLLYVISNNFDEIEWTLALFKVDPDGLGLSVIGGDQAFGFIWPVSNVEPWGPIFVSCEYWIDNETGMHCFFIVLFVYDESAFHRRYAIRRSELLTEHDLELAVSGQDIEEFVTYKLRSTDEWRQNLIDFQNNNSVGGLGLHIDPLSPDNLYGWHEVPLAD